MNLYTEEDLQKRAWIADSIQADIMIDAIEASYKGDTDLFHCLMNKTVNLHWLSESLKGSCLAGDDPECCSECLTEEQISRIVLQIEKICGSPCLPNPQILLSDSIPDIIKYSE